jgi:flagellar basal-body rod modification protein FlgD
MTVGATNNTGIKGSIGSQARDSDAYDKLDLNKFIDLLVAEFQNQDPTNPMDNAQILQQISQIREIAANDKLTESLNSVALGQSVSTASTLLGKTITGLDADSNKVTGKVDSVTVADGVTTLHVGEKTVELKNVGEILPEATT